MKMKIYQTIAFNIMRKRGFSNFPINLIDKLKFWRRSIANLLSVNERFICNKSALSTIAVTFPKSANDLSMINGLSKEFQSIWGTEILDIVREHIEGKPFVLSTSSKIRKSSEEPSLISYRRSKLSQNKVAHELGSLKWINIGQLTETQKQIANKCLVGLKSYSNAAYCVNGLVGSGKSFLTHYIIQELSSSVCSSDEIVRLDGKCLLKQLKITHGESKDALLCDFLADSDVVEVLTSAKIIVIENIHFVHKYDLDVLDELLNYLTSGGRVNLLKVDENPINIVNYKPFGGISVFFTSDFGKNANENSCLLANVWKNSNLLKVINFDSDDSQSSQGVFNISESSNSTPMRSEIDAIGVSPRNYHNVIAMLRSGEAVSEIATLLSTCAVVFKPYPEVISPVKIHVSKTPLNIRKLNKEVLNAYSGVSQSYSARDYWIGNVAVGGAKSQIKAIDPIASAWFLDEVELKVGAQVQLLRHIYEYECNILSSLSHLCSNNDKMFSSGGEDLTIRVAHGSVGVVIGFMEANISSKNSVQERKYPVILFDNGITLPILPVSCVAGSNFSSDLRFSIDCRGLILIRTQLPLRLAWHAHYTDCRTSIHTVLPLPAAVSDCSVDEILNAYSNTDILLEQHVASLSTSNALSNAEVLLDKRSIWSGMSTLKYKKSPLGVNDLVYNALACALDFRGLWVNEPLKDTWISK